LTKIVDLDGREYTPSWSPDGKQVLFAATMGYGSEVFVVDVASGELTQLTETVGHKTEPAWSPDGTRISFTQLDGFNQGDVWVMNADGSDKTNLTENPAHDCCAVWSPDGKQLAFLSSRSDEGAGLLPSGRNGAYLLASRLVQTDSGSNSLAAADRPRALTTVMPERLRDIYLMNYDGSGLRNLTSGRGYESDPAWSPSGEHIAFVSDRDGNREIYIIKSDGSEPTRLTDDPGDDRFPAWSPAGKCIAFQLRSENDYGIYLMNPDGSGLWKLADSTSRSQGPVWSP
jgi:TolB protein